MRAGDSALGTPCFKRELTLEYRVLIDIMAGVVERQQGPFDKLTEMHYRMIIDIVLGERLNWSELLYSRMVGEIRSSAKCSALWKSCGILVTYILHKLCVKFEGECKNLRKKCNNKNSIDCWKTKQHVVSGNATRSAGVVIDGRVQRHNLQARVSAGLVDVCISVREDTPIDKKRKIGGRQ